MINKIIIIILLFQIKLDLGCDHKWLLTFKKSGEETNTTHILMENMQYCCEVCLQNGKKKKSNMKALQPPDATNLREL